MMFYGLLDLNWWQYLLTTLILVQISIFCVTVYLHRNQAHRALDLHPIVSHACRLWLWLATGMETKAWTAIHRKHHARCEMAEDPHSPQILGIDTVLWQGAELYRKEAINAETLERYGKGTPEDWLEKNLYSRFSGKGFYILLLAYVILFGVPGIAMWAIQMVWIPFWAAGVINGIGHYVGYRNFECPDASRNISPIGFFIGGEELHNNHHTYPTSAKFSVKWWEFDIGWLYIKILETFGLAKAKRVPPKTKILDDKTKIDGSTLTDIITNRFQVSTRYIQTVIIPVFRQEISKISSRERKLFNKLKQPLTSSEFLVDAKTKAALEKELEKTPSLQQVYQFRKSLQDIWSSTTASQKELIDALHDWCAKAEATGVKVLQDFAHYLKSYSLLPARV